MKRILPSKSRKSGKKNSIVRQNVSSPFDHKIITKSEARRLASELLVTLRNSYGGPTDKLAATAILISLITGLPVETLNTIPCSSEGGCEEPGLYWSCISNQWVLLRQFDTPHRNLVDDPGVALDPDALVCKKTGPAVYPLPRELSEYLPMAIRHEDRDALTIQAEKIVAKHSTKIPRPINLKMVGKFAENYMLQERACFADFLTLPSRKKEVEAGLYYLQTKRSDVLNSYQRFLDDLGSTPTLIDLEDEYIGSALVPQPEEIQDVFAQMFWHLQHVDFGSITGFQQYHNWFATYVATMLRIASGSRAERRTSVSLAHLNLQDGLWYVEEKCTTRVVPLPKVVIDQLNSYIAYLSHIKELAKHSDRHLFDRLARILSDGSKQPLLFSANGPALCTAISETDDTRAMGLGLKRNSFRHAAYTNLITRLTEESLRQVIGHTRFYNDSCVPYSGQSFEQYETIRTEIEGIMTGLKIKAFNPLACAASRNRKAA